MSRPRRLVAALITGAVATAVAAAALSGLPTRAEAAPAATSSAASILQAFNPADIISDAVMYNPNTMSVAQIQSFLNAQQPTCASGYTCLKTYRTSTQTMAANLMCSTYVGQSNESAATIIYKVAHSCRINPQVILVTLQKEQGLITGVNLSWYPNAYRSATGLDCPDTAPCDPSKYGFFNQVYGLGYWLIRYTTPPGTTGPGWTSFSWFPVGKTSYILYNPDYSCGSQPVTIANKATASLYYYTPYVPNRAALAAGYGTGDSCSAYGNRNFFLYFTQWFGSTHITVTGAIQTYWTSHSSLLGGPTANAVTSTSNGGGTYQTFQYGTVYSSPAGTYSIRGALLSEYNRRGGVTGSLRWPIADQTTVTTNGGGLMQRFGSGELYSSTAGIYAVQGDLRTAYLAAGGVNGSLGFPTDAAATLGTGWVQHFTKGTVYFQAATGGFGVPSAIDAGYTARKGPAGPLGWPTKAAASRTVAGLTGTVQSFQNGDLYTSAAGTGAVMAPLRSAYSATGDQLDALGWPRGDAAASTANGGGTIQVFTGGRVYVPTGKPVVAVAGRILAAYLAGGETTGPLGWPLSQSALVTAHGTAETLQTFSTGAAYQRGTTVTTVSGDLYTAYSVAGGPTGPLGWVTGSAVSSSVNGGGWTQSFAGGTVFYSSVSQKAVPVTGGLMNLYRSRDAAAGDFGWPVSAPAWVTAHGSRRVVQSFEHGSYTVSGSTVVAVSNPVYAAYVAAGGPTGPLGWPLSQPAAATAHGTTETVQTFSAGAAYQRGAAVTTVSGDLYAAYVAAGGPAGPLGWVTGSAVSSSVNGGGWTQSFASGTVFYSSVSQKAVPVTGGLMNLYRSRDAAAGDFGWPVSAPAWVTAHGSRRVVQSFEHGSYTVSGSTVVAVSGAVYAAYLADGGPTGPLGWVTGSAVSSSVNGGGWTQSFAGGTVFYSSVSQKAFPVTGGLMNLYRSRNAAAGDFGWPVSAPAWVTAHGSRKVVQSFEHGSYTVSGSTVVAVSGPVYGAYLADGGPTGPLGWVSSAVASSSASGGGWSQAFGGGTIYCSSVSGNAFPVTGALLTYYASNHEAAGPLGWPTGVATTSTVSGAAVTSQPFQHGTLTSTNGVVTVG